MVWILFFFESFAEILFFSVYLKKLQTSNIFSKTLILGIIWPCINSVSEQLQIWQPCRINLYLRCQHGGEVDDFSTNCHNILRFNWGGEGVHCRNTKIA